MILHNIIINYIIYCTHKMMWRILIAAYFYCFPYNVHNPVVRSHTIVERHADIVLITAINDARKKGLTRIYYFLS